MIKKVFILGSGGREHAIGWAFKNCGFEVFFSPGNAGTSEIGENVVLESYEELSKFDLVIPGSENYLAFGVANGRNNVFGPIKEVAMLESSKAFAKEFMKKYEIRTARFKIVESVEFLSETLSEFNPPYVLKIDGLAQGKGVIIEKTFESALENGTKLMRGELVKGVSGKIVVEEYLQGSELSAMAIVNGDNFALLPFTRDYKRAYTGNIGPNTGGMGAYGPIQISDHLKREIEDLYSKTLFGLRKDGLKYKGFLYLGLMISEGMPYVLEYNVRLGDPETEVIVSMAPEKFVENVVNALTNGSFSEYSPSLYALDVVLASEGYPENPKKGQTLTIEKNFSENQILFYGGVEKFFENYTVSGGRVMHCVGTGESLEKARENAYSLTEKVKFEGKYFRTDIGLEG